MMTTKTNFLMQNRKASIKQEAGTLNFFFFMRHERELISKIIDIYKRQFSLDLAPHFSLSLFLSLCRSLPPSSCWFLLGAFKRGRSRRHRGAERCEGP
jgi:hypothetical protein